jgi:hypothetical protein
VSWLHTLIFEEQGCGMGYVAVFFAGALLCNCLPHLAGGLSGAPFPTPFAKPHGVGNSSPLVNFLWGAGNCVLGLYLLTLHPVTVGPNVGFLVLLAGALLLGSRLAVHFGRVRAGAKAQ